MKPFLKTELPDIISVKSVVSVHHVNIKGGAPIPDIHDFWELAYVERGTFRVLVDGNEKRIEAGECILYPPLAMHIGACPQNVELKIVSFESESSELHELAGRNMPLGERSRKRMTEIINAGLKNLKPSGNANWYGMVQANSFNRYDMLRLKKELELIIIELLDKEYGNTPVCSAENRKKELATALSDYLKMNISKSLTLPEIAEELSVSTSHLKAISNDTFGMPPIAYFITLKIDAAKRLIRESSLNFTEISLRLGFNTVHYFSYLFKKRVGMSPTEYARSQYK